MLLNQPQTPTLVHTLTASLLRRSCSFFRAVSLSFSTGEMEASMLDFGVSTSLRVSNVALVQMFSVGPACVRRASSFSCALAGSRELKGREALMRAEQTSSLTLHASSLLMQGTFHRVAQYQALPGDPLLSFPSTCFFRAFARSFSRAAFRNCWKASLDDFPEASATD